MIITPLTYFGPISWWKLINTYEYITFDIHHNYIKQTYRNRCSILSANGKLNLYIPVIKTYGNHTPYKDIKIDNKQRWQNIHKKAVMSGYKASPYYDFLIDEISDVWNKKYNYLLDLALDTFLITCKILKIKINYKLSEEYIQPNELNHNIIDLRNIKIYTDILEKPIKKYTQVFSDRFEFIDDLSVLDKVFNDREL